MRRSALEQAGYLDLDYHYLLDVELWLRMASIAEPVYVPDVLWSAARMHDDAKNHAKALDLVLKPSELPNGCVKMSDFIHSTRRFITKYGRVPIALTPFIVLKQKIIGAR